MSRSHSSAARDLDRFGRCLALLAFCGSAWWLFGCQKPPQPSPPSLATAKAALSQGDYLAAERAALAIPPDHRDRNDALAVAGEACLKDHRTADAVKHYETLAKRQRQEGTVPLGLFYAAEAYRNAGRLTEAEALYRQFRESAPQHVLTNERLAFLTSISGRRWQSVPYYFVLIKSGKAEITELILFGDLDRPIEQRPYLEQCAIQAPNDVIVQLGLAAHSLWEGDSAEALLQLRSFVEHTPEVIAAQAMLGELLVNAEDAEFLRWHERLPTGVDEHPDIHFVRGLWARKHDQTEMAARCFWESIRRAPTNRRATFQLGQVLRSLNHPASKAVETRSKQLIQLTQLIDQALRGNSPREGPIRGIINLLEQMGRLWEAAAWGIIARREFPTASWIEPTLERLGGQLRNDLPLVLEKENLAEQIDLSSFPIFRPTGSRTTKSAVDIAVASDTKIHFTEMSPGPVFTYENGHDPATPGARMFEQNGGGVAVLDFDGDGWPDLFFTQGGIWLTGKAEPEPPGLLTDRLFRNHNGQLPVDVTKEAGLIDRGFGQGATVGDFDNDGFPDLYVGNVGRNQLLHNNGDGTFTDITDSAGITATDWTASCVMVDLNADGWPDLFDVNYLTGPQVYERICQEKACSPSVFAGAPDRLLLNRGDGTLERVPPETPEVDGKGLGIIAFGLHERGRPSLLIANDQVPNFLLRNEPTADTHRPRLIDEAFVSGVAFNQEGLAMASMGIAADDVDGDGHLDFYVSTFKDESSLLLMHDSSGLFVDRAATAGLRAATWPYVGWGTQFLDADCDGDPDLVGVNGHVDDYRGDGGEYHMRPQFFRNVSAGRFEEQTAEQVGSFFERKRLGRGLARLDWNRDGLMDFAVSNIGHPASLVINETRAAGQFVGVRLSATRTARDAIGSVVEVQAGNRTWKKQLVAGDGYMASNERWLQFGLGPADRVDKITVQWPSGSVTVAENVPVGVTLEFIELSSRAVQRHNPTTSAMFTVTSTPVP